MANFLKGIYFEEVSRIYMYLNFHKARYWVQISCLPAYLFWCLREASKSPEPIREMLRCIVFPSWHLRLNDELAAAKKKANEVGVKIGWIRYPTDGTRITIFDRRGDRICKVHYDRALLNTIPTEIRIRTNAGSLAPAILAISSDQLALVEEWVSGHPPHFSVDQLTEVVKRLQRDVYTIEHISCEQYRDLLALYGNAVKVYEEIVDLALVAFSKEVLPIGQVHGDLICQNINYDPKRGITLLDWEYSRKCIATYDCWLYFYHYRRTDQRTAQSPQLPIPEEYYSDLSRILCLVNTCDSKTKVSARQLLHLIERQVFLSSVAPGRTVGIRQIIERDIYAEADRLSRLMACG